MSFSVLIAFITQKLITWLQNYYFSVSYEATIVDNQEGQDSDTGETKTLNNV